MAGGKARKRLKARREENLIQLINSMLLSNPGLEGDGIGQDDHICDPALSKFAVHQVGRTEFILIIESEK